MTKAIVKKDLGNMKAGTVLYFAGGVFAHESSAFLPEDVYFDDVHFEIIENSSVFADVLIDQPSMTSGNLFTSLN